MIPTLSSNTGILLVGHGTRDAIGQAEFLQCAELLQARLSGVSVEPCFLELAEPDIPTGLHALASSGVERVIAAPLLLFTAGHAKRDIPDAIAAAARQHPDLCWQMAAPLEDHAALLQLSAERFHEALPDQVEQGTDATLLFVGRGSSDHEAIQSVHHFVRQRLSVTPIARHRVCFLAAATPTFEETIDWAMEQPTRHVVVQPHLLFRGRLVDDIAARVAAARKKPAGADKTWHIAAHLGPSPAVVDALHDRICEALD